DRLARPLPVEIVVEKEDAPGREARVEMDQLVARRRVPVGVEAKERDALRRGPGERLLDLSLHEAELLARVAGRQEIPLHLLERRVAPIRPITIAEALLRERLLRD